MIKLALNFFTRQQTNTIKKLLDLNYSTIEIYDKLNLKEECLLDKINLIKKSKDLFEAISKNDCLKVRSLSSNTEILNMKDNLGNTPFLYAVRINKLNIAKFLMTKNIDVNVLNNSKQNAMMWCFYNGEYNFATHLIKNGFNFNIIIDNESLIKIIILDWIKSENRVLASIYLNEIYPFFAGRNKIDFNSLKLKLISNSFF